MRFDLDDTLFDHLGTARAAFTATCADEPALCGADLDALSQHYGELLEELHPRLLASELSVAAARQQRFGRLLASYGLGAAAANEVAVRYYAHYRQLRRPLPGAVPLLGALVARYRLGIITNNCLAEQQDKLRCLGLTDLLPGLVTSEEVGAVKPDLRIFAVALWRWRGWGWPRLGVAPAEVVLVGDSWGADIEGALLFFRLFLLCCLCLLNALLPAWMWPMAVPSRALTS